MWNWSEIELSLSIWWELNKKKVRVNNGQRAIEQLKGVENYKFSKRIYDSHFQWCPLSGVTSVKAKPVFMMCYFLIVLAQIKNFFWKQENYRNIHVSPNTINNRFSEPIWYENWIREMKMSKKFIDDFTC